MHSSSCGAPAECRVGVTGSDVLVNCKRKGQQKIMYSFFMTQNCESGIIIIIVVVVVNRTWPSSASPNLSCIRYALTASFPLPLPLSRLPFLLICGLGLLSFCASYPPSSISVKLDALLSMLVRVPGRFPLPLLPGS